MKRNNLLNFFVKAVLACMVLTAAAKTAFAQITLDLDVLTDDLPSEKTKTPTVSESEQNSKISLKKPTVKSKTTTRAVSPKKTKPTAKKTTVVPKEKLKIQESGREDEHDKLKPHAAPVPKVKILAAESGEIPAEQPSVSSEKTSEPKLSKHFLEQESVSAPSEGTVPTVPPKEEKPTETTQPISAAISETTETTETTEQTTAAEETKSPILNFSVFPVPEKADLFERSLLLSKELPQESATVKALTDKRMLQHILIFEKKSVHLTEEMQNALDTVAAGMKKKKDQRLILYSYCAEDLAEPGKERQCSLRRALMVRSYLTTQGIHSLRIELRSQGKKGAGDKIPDRTDIVIQNR